MNLFKQTRDYCVPKNPARTGITKQNLRFPWIGIH